MLWKGAGFSSEEVHKHLLTQFCRGCWNDSLLTEIQLKQKKTLPPPFAELLLLLRMEEDRHTAKAMRMKQYLGATKQKTASHVHTACSGQEEKDTRAALATKNLVDRWQRSKISWQQ